MKNKYKSYSFWMSVTGAVVLVLNNLGKAFGFTFDNQVFTNIVDSVCGVLVVLGILTMPKSEKSSNQDETDDTEKDEKSKQKDDNSICEKNQNDETKK